MFANPAKLAMAALAAFVVMFIGDYLWWVVIFKSWAASAMQSAGNDSIPLHAIGELSFACLMAIIYPMGFKGGSAMMEGIWFGILMGLVAGMPSAIHHFASVGGSGMIPCFLICNSLFIGIIGGLTVAMVYGKSAGAKM